MHCIISGGGLTADQKIKKSKRTFFIPVGVLRDKFKGKYLAELDSLYKDHKLTFSSSCEKLKNSYEWSEFRNDLYKKTGVLMSRKLSTDSATRLSILADIHIRFPFPTAGS